MSQPARRYILTACCADQIGIVKDVTTFLFGLGAGVTDAAQFRDEYDQRFFMRVEFAEFERELPELDELESLFAPIAHHFEMEWKLYDGLRKPKILIAVSKFGHCLNDLLYRWDEGELAGDLVGVVSNHEQMRSKVEWYGLPYHYMPVQADSRAEQEAQLLKIMEDSHVDLLVLARYMQILSSDLCHHLKGRAINIHHSFLPSFKGARPYHQAYERGVKVMGATAHYVTGDLDEGPIIEQDVQRVEHSHDVEDLVHLGRDVENVVLARALKWHCERRVLLNGQKTVIFK